MTLKPPKEPCGTCPYRRDVPAGIWAAEEYAKLIDYDRPTGEQPFAVFMCHQHQRGDGCICGGWLVTHDRHHLMALRVHAADLDPSVWDYAPKTPVFGSGAQAAAHGISGIAAPDAAARRKINGLLKQRKKGPPRP